MPPSTVVVLGHTGTTGGAELALHRLLGAIDPDRFAVRVVLFADGPLVGMLREVGVPVEVCELRTDLVERDRGSLLARPLVAARDALAVLSFAQTLSRRITDSDADLVVANSLKSAVIGAAAARMARRPLVWHLHDRLSEDYLSAPVARAMRTMARRMPARIVANSRATAATLGAFDPARVVIAHPGLPASAFNARPDPRTPREPAIGMIGRISPTKGQDVFLRAAAIVLADGRQASFHIIGSALFGERDHERAMHRLASDLGITEHVEFAGWSDDPRARLLDLDLLVHASPVPEPFGQVITEGMAAGVPVIATDAGGAIEILDPEGPSPGPATRRTELGQLVRPGDPAALADAMLWTLDHPDEACEMASRARRSAEERFTIERSAEAVQAAWSDAIEISAARRSSRTR